MTEMDFGTYYKQQTADLIDRIGEERMNVLKSYDFCEMEDEFICFIHVYKDLENIPKDFTIIDVGCNQAPQAELFKDHTAYIGIDSGVPCEYRLAMDNAKYYYQTAQDFVAETLPQLVKDGLDLEKCFAVCSYVPDTEAQELVKAVFPYYRCVYCGDVSEKNPKGNTLNMFREKTIVERDKAVERD